MVTFEYIASGLGFTKILNNTTLSSSAVDKINDTLKEHQGKYNHLYGFLFNAHTEIKFGENIGVYNEASSIYADSGGLQMVTLGIDIDDKAKNNVYKVQSKYSDYGMSFDEIPINVVGDRSSRKETNNRFFDGDNLNEYSRLAGINLRNQIDLYDKNNSDTKPIMILQGNCYDTYCKYTDNMMKQLSNDHINRIGGVASGSAAFGNGELEMAERFFMLPYMPIPEHITNHIHVLGIGVIKNMLPILIYSRNNHIHADKISYDSTTQTCTREFGNYYTDKGKVILIGRDINSPNFEFIHNEITNMFGVDISKKDLFTVLNVPPSKLTGMDLGLYHYIFFLYIFANILNTCKCINDVYNGDIKINDIVGNKKSNIYTTLNKVSTYKEFNEWKRLSKGLLTSAKVNKTNNNNSLLDFI